MIDPPLIRNGTGFAVKSAHRQIRSTFSNSATSQAWKQHHHFQVSSYPDSSLSSVTMSAKTEHTSKKFGSGSRTVPHHSQKASKWYPAEDVPEKKQVSRDSPHPIYSCCRTLGHHERGIGLGAVEGASRLPRSC